MALLTDFAEVGVLEAAGELQAVAQDPVTGDMESPQQPKERDPARSAQDIAEQQYPRHDIGVHQVVADGADTVVERVAHH